MQNRTFFLSLCAGIACLAMHAQTRDEAIGDTMQIREVVVTGTRNETPLSMLPTSVTVVDHARLTENFRPSILPTLTEQVPGLFTTSRGLLGYGVNSGAGNMMMRGVGYGASGSVNQMLVLIDGQPQYAGLMGHPIPDAYQTVMAERVEVVRGPASMLYGSNAMGGVVNIVTRQMVENGQHTNIQLGAGSYGTLQGEATNRLRYGKFSSVVGVSYQRTDGHRPDSKFEQETGFVKLGYDLNNHWKLVADADIVHFEISNPGPVTSPLIDNDFTITRGLASFSVQNNYAATNGTLRGFYDWGHHKIDDGYSPGGTPRDNFYLHDDHIAGITWYQSASLFLGNRTTVGLDWQNFGGHAWNRYHDGRPNNELADTTQNEVGAYVDFRQTIAPWITLDAGIRLDWHSQVGTELVPQGGVTFHPSKNDDLKAIVSKGFRNPIIREMYMFPPKNPDLKPERMMNYELSYTHRISERGHVGANLFLIKGDNLIANVRQASGRMLNVNTGSFTNHGLELTGDYRFSTHWSANANYSYLHMKKPIMGAPEGKLYVGANYECGPFALVVGLQHISDLYLTNGVGGLRESFTLLNATASYRIIPQIRLYVKGDNLLAERYQTYNGYPMPKATFMGGVSIDL